MQRPPYFSIFAFLIQGIRDGNRIGVHLDDRIEERAAFVNFLNAF